MSCFIGNAHATYALTYYQNLSVDLSLTICRSGIDRVGDAEEPTNGSRQGLLATRIVFKEESEADTAKNMTWEQQLYATIYVHHMRLLLNMKLFCTDTTQ